MCSSHSCFPPLTPLRSSKRQETVFDADDPSELSSCTENNIRCALDFISVLQLPLLSLLLIVLIDRLK